MSLLHGTHHCTKLLQLIMVIVGLSVASPSFAIKYDVEVIIFEHIRDTSTGSSDTLLLPVVRGAQSIPDIQLTPAQALSQQPDTPIQALSTLRLQDHAAKIKQSNNHRLLYHGGWRQTNFDQENAPYMRIALGRPVTIYTEPGEVDSLYRKGYITPPLDSNFRYDQKTMTSLYGGIKVWVGRFLHFETLLSYTPRGANYSFSMQTDRRMRSRQIHYMDNPRIGIITKIFPVDDTQQQTDYHFAQWQANAMVKKGIKQLISDANEVIESISAEEAIAISANEDVTIVDLRDIRELQREGRIPGSVHAPRGMLEFWVDPDSPYHKPVFATGNRMVLHCASGWRSALATQTLVAMGLENVCHIDSGYKGWKDAGGNTEAVEKK